MTSLNMTIDRASLQRDAYCMETHRHNTDPSKGRVCSSMVTAAQLVEFGVLEAEGVGSDWFRNHGGGQEITATCRAIHRAWEADFVRICTVDPREGREARAAAQEARNVISAEWVAEVRAFFGR